MVKKKSSSIPTVSFEMANRIFSNVEDNDIIEILNRMNEQNRELYDFFFSNEAQDKFSDRIVLDSNYFPAKASVLLYGLVEQACLESGENHDLTDFTTRGVPVVSKNTIDSLLDGNKGFLASQEYSRKINDNNPVIAHMIYSLTFPRLNINREDGRFKANLEAVNINTGLMYAFLDSQYSANMAMKMFK